MTVIPDKHTFTIWQGATFFEVLTLYETNDKTQPRDFYTETKISNLTVTTTNGSAIATLNSTSGLVAGKKYYISSTTIPSSSYVYFTAPESGNTITLSSGSAVTAGTSTASVITLRTLNYGAEMIIRDKAQGTPLLTLSTNATGATVNNISPTSSGCSIVLPDNPANAGQIRLIISDTVTATLGTSSTWKTGVYDFTITELVDPVTSGRVTDALLYGGIKVNGV
jgi:hypothetical protein